MAGMLHSVQVQMADELIAARGRIAELEAAAKMAFAAIGVARCIRAVSDEYDFEPAYVALRGVLLPSPAPAKPLPDPRTCDHDWRPHPDHQSACCRKCGMASVQN